MGFPKGNTITIVGDPGTGKTTFLLLFFQRASVNKNNKKEVVLFDIEASGILDSHSRALRTFDALISIDSDRGLEIECKKTNQSETNIRIFISLDNSFESIKKSHGSLLPRYVSGKDAWFFIDATSLLSGRLQDGLRYPKLGLLTQKQHQGWVVHDFTLGGWNPTSDKGLAWYWINESTPELLNNISPAEGPLQINKSDSNGPCCRVIRLLTPTIKDPLIRIRLLKDLLAEIFAHNKSHKKIYYFLAIDSLSSLLADLFIDSESSPKEYSGDRLHILNLVRWLEELDVTTLLSSESSHQAEESLRGRPLFIGGLERYLASGIIQLDYHLYSSGDVIRYLQILKMRGARHDMRPYAYDLDSLGISWLEPLIVYRKDEQDG